jgi:lytic murein transglycosylase
MVSRDLRPGAVFRPDAPVPAFTLPRRAAPICCPEPQAQKAGHMRETRRAVAFGLAAAVLAACSNPAPRAGLAAPRGAEPDFPARPDPGWDAWVAAFRTRATSQGIAPATLEGAFRNAGFLPGVIERDRNQTEFTRSLEDYLSIAASDERIAMGRAMLARYGPVLSRIETTYGVEAPVVAAIWGLESFYGTRRGKVPVISALSTLAYEGRRGAFFEGQLVAALKILQNGDVTAAGMTGSWAGAMGHTQFIPTSYLAYAVDFDGDGRRDIWSDDPTDALASTAAYLARSGWVRGQPWGVEVRLPAGFNTALAGRGSSRAVADWMALGLRDADGGTVPDHGAASLLIPAGSGGPAFLVFRNFTVITRYNNAESYVIGVGHLSDRLRGRGPLRAGFGPDATGMTKEQRQEMQRLLTAAGFDTGGSDGVIGPKTRAAISAFQARRGIAVTGEPSLALLALLKTRA